MTTTKYYVNLGHDEAFSKATNYIDTKPYSLIKLLFTCADDKLPGSIENRLITINKRYQWSLIPYKTTIAFNTYGNNKSEITVSIKPRNYYMLINILLMVILYGLILSSQFLSKSPSSYVLLFTLITISVPNIFFFNKAYSDNNKKIDSFIRQLYSYYFLKGN
jgi:hypothetical protein